MTFWSNDKIINFINFIRFRPVIWDINSHIYKDRNARKSAWREITHKFNISQEDAQKKFKNLRTYFQNEKRKLKTRQRSGNADCAESVWFAFKQMDAFLNNDLSADGWTDRDNDTEGNQKCSKTEVGSNNNGCEPETADQNNITIDTIPHPRARPKPCKSTRLRKIQQKKDIKFQETNATANEAHQKVQPRINSQPEDSNYCKSEAVNNDIASDSSSPALSPPKVRKILKRKTQNRRLKRFPNVSAAANESQKRSHSAFGDHIAQKLESYNKFVRSQVEFKISQILFEADMGHFDEPTRSEYSTRLQTSTTMLPVHALMPEVGEEIDEKPPFFADDNGF